MDCHSLSPLLSSSPVGNHVAGYQGERDSDRSCRDVTDRVNPDLSPPRRVR